MIRWIQQTRTYFAIFRRNRQLISAGIKESRRVENMQGQLRRNLHRLEKGIYHKHRREEFGVIPCREILEVLLSVDLNIHWLTDEFKSYCNDVLTRYFEVAPLDEQMKDQMNAVLERIGASNYILPTRTNKNTSTEIEDVIKSRKSVRFYDKTKHLSNDQILEAITLALNSPSACNRQPFEVFISQRGGRIHNELTTLPLGTKGWHKEIETFLIIVGDWSNFQEIRDWKVPITDGSLFAMQLILILSARGVSSCPINWSDVPHNNDQLRKLLKLPTHKSAIMTIAIGYADESVNFPISLKKSALDVTTFIEAT